MEALLQPQVIAPVVGVLVIAVSAYWLASRTQLAQKRSAEEWLAVASRRGGQYHPGIAGASGWKQTHALDVASGHIRVRAEIEGGTGNDRGSTIVRAAYLTGGGPRFEVSTKPLLPTGAIELPGHPAFSNHFMVRTPDPVHVVGELWSPRARELAMVLATGNRMAVTSDGRTITLRWRDRIRDARYLDTAIDLVLELARPLG